MMLSSCFRSCLLASAASGRSYASLGLAASRLSLAAEEARPRIPLKEPASSPLGRLRRSFSTETYPDESNCQNDPIAIMDTIKGADWADRIALQARYSNADKGWQVEVEWKTTPFGVGLFAKEDIAHNSILRIGTNGKNLRQFQNVEDIESFCREGNPVEYQARLDYVSDYLWGFTWKNADEQGYALEGANTNSNDGDRFFGMWIPGNGLNHNPSPNVVYRTRQGGTSNGIVLLALRDIRAGEELYDDYIRHGRAPEWLVEFSRNKQVTLNFADCNDFVDPS